MRKISTPEIKEEALRLYKENHTTAEISKIIGFSRQTIGDWINAAGIKFDESYIFKRSYSSGRRKAEDQSACNRTHFFPFDTFEKEITSELAWVLGLLFGDGCIVRKKDGTFIAIELVGTEDVCYKFAKIMQYNGLPSKITNKNCYHIKLNSKQLAESLSTQFGMTPNKSRTMEFPSMIPDSMLNHFVRGFWDADGCMTIYKKKYLSLQARSASKPFMDKILELAQEHTNTKSSLVLSKDGTYSVSLSCNNAKLMGEWLYKDSADSIRCEKKYNKFIAYQNL